MSGDVGHGFDYGLVQHQACPVCGHDTSGMPAVDLAAAATDVGRRWHEFLSTVSDHPGGAEELRQRPEPQVWSAIEYACHVRDVLALFSRRVELTLVAKLPEYGWWDHEAAVTAGHYVDQDPLAVADDIHYVAVELARLSQGLGPDELNRQGTRLGTTFTVDGLVRFAIHEALHHLVDARAAVAVSA